MDKDRWIDIDGKVWKYMDGYIDKQHTGIDG